MAMHSNWNPWHGCRKCSEGCQNCYVYYLDGMQGKSGSDIYRTKSGFRYPLSKDRKNRYKIFIKDGRAYRIGDKSLQNLQAFRSGLSYQGRKIHIDLKDSFGLPVPAEDLYVPHYADKCETCSFRILCNGCSDCGVCEGSGN